MLKTGKKLGYREFNTLIVMSPKSGWQLCFRGSPVTYYN